MPIYEYRCSVCGFEKEYLQRLSDTPISVCESCGQSAMTKLISAAGFQLKGSGWYATDFKNNGAKPKGKEEAKTESAPGEAAAAESAPGKSAPGKSAPAEPAATPSTDTKSTAEAGAGAKPASQSTQ